MPPVGPSSGRGGRPGAMPPRAGPGDTRWGNSLPPSFSLSLSLFPSPSFPLSLSLSLSSSLSHSLSLSLSLSLSVCLSVFGSLSGSSSQSVSEYLALAISLSFLTLLSTSFATAPCSPLLRSFVCSQVANYPSIRVTLCPTSPIISKTELA